MRLRPLSLPVAVAAGLALLLSGVPSGVAFAQDQAAADQTDTADSAAEAPPEPLSDEEMQVLVARIALYPDELIAVISEASLYPLQIVEAARFLDKAEKDKNLKPKESWDGSVISLLNYPEVVRMMSDDLEWTQTLGDALTYQQKDVLIAIQQLRDKAVADGAIKSDDKVKVDSSGDNVVIQSANPDVIYVPQYEPETLYAPGVQVPPVGYYPDPYPSYWYPTATFFAATVTGAVWASAVDWDDWGVWGGRWNGGDIDVDCNNCLNNINGKVNFNDIDWKNVDRSKLKFDRDQFTKIDRTAMRDRVKANNGNSLKSKAGAIRKEHPRAGGDRPRQISDVRKTKVGDLKGKAGADRAGQNIKRPAGGGKAIDRPKVNKAASRIERPVGKPRPAAKLDNRPKHASGLGNPRAGKREAVASRRGSHSMGGGARGGSRPHMSAGRGGGGHARGGGRRR
jgi:hypothetical protein